MDNTKDNVNPLAQGDIRLGRYRHYKGGEYELLGVATPTEDDEERPHAVYVSCNSRLMFVRPLHGPGGWLTPVKLNNGMQARPRFVRIGPGVMSAVEKLWCSIEPPSPPISATERELRKLLWLTHKTGHILYGDDGEMQCSTCGLDFLRLSPDDLKRAFAYAPPPVTTNVVWKGGEADE